MLRRLFLLSPLVLQAGSLLSAEVSPKIALVYFSWYDNTFQQRIRPSDIDDTTRASLQAPGQVTQVANWIGRDLKIRPIPIVVRDPYPVNYEDCLDQAVEEKTRRFEALKIISPVLARERQLPAGISCLVFAV